MNQDKQIYFEKVKENSQIVLIEKLAKIIFKEVYEFILPNEQITFLLTRFQSFEAIKNQIQINNYAYYLIKYKGGSIGYFGVKFFTDIVYLSKIYILKEYRGMQIGTISFNYLFNLTRVKGISKIELLVNINNKNAIDIYLNKGFKIKESTDTILDNGFVFKDHIMVKTLF